MIQNPLSLAIEYATAVSSTGGEHEGEAWHLLVHFSGGNSAEVAVAVDQQAKTYRLERGREEISEAPAGEPIFINPGAVTHVEVLWI